MSGERFAVRLRELREAAGLSRKELADKAGMRSEAGIRNLEQGIRSPAWETVLALAQALGVTCEAFTQEPATSPEPKRGRPRKAESEPEAPGPAAEPERPAGKKKGTRKRKE